MSIALLVFEAIVLASSCSIDAFTAGFAYGSNKIKVPMLSNQIINIICSSVLGLSLLMGALLRQYLPEGLTIIICFIILFLLGIMKLLDSITKSIIRKYNRREAKLNKEIRFSMFNFKFILNLYANPEDADVDENKVLSSSEAVALAVSLSLDGIAVGFGAALGNINVLAVILASLVTNVVAVMLGNYFGNKLARKVPFSLTWLSGVVLLVMAFMKLF